MELNTVEECDAIIAHAQLLKAKLLKEKEESELKDIVDKDGRYLKWPTTIFNDKDRRLYSPIIQAVTNAPHSQQLTWGVNACAKFGRVGMLFNTHENAVKQAQRDLLIQEIRVMAAELNDGWVPDWNNGYELKHIVYYSY